MPDEYLRALILELFVEILVNYVEEHTENYDARYSGKSEQGHGHIVVETVSVCYILGADHNNNGYYEA